MPIILISHEGLKGGKIYTPITGPLVEALYRQSDFGTTVWLAGRETTTLARNPYDDLKLALQIAKQAFVPIKKNAKGEPIDVEINANSVECLIPKTSRFNWLSRIISSDECTIKFYSGHCFDAVGSPEKLAEEIGMASNRSPKALIADFKLAG